MKNFNLKFLVLFVFLSSSSFSQNSRIKKVKRFLATPWIFEIGEDIIEDDGSNLTGLFAGDLSHHMNMEKYPSRFGVTKFINNGFKAQFFLNFNHYKPGEIIDHTIYKVSKFVFTMDLHVNYHLNEIVRLKNWWEPYIVMGYGFTDRGHVMIANHNVGLGSNFWLYKNLGLNMEALGKWSLSSHGSNYVQFSFGLICKVGKGKSIIETDAHKRAKNKIRRIIL